MTSTNGTFAQLMATADSAMIVVTTAMALPSRTGERVLERAGCLVGFHAQASIEPALYCVWLSRANHTYRVALLAEHLAVHFLTEDDFDVAEHFGTTSGDDSDKFAEVEFDEGPGGLPLLARCPNRLVMRRDTLIDVGGDHALIMGDVIDESIVDGGSFEPLRFSAVTGLEPGHEAEDRPRPPTERAP